MSRQYPYAVAAGHIGKVILQFRKTLPPRINADTLRKLSIAPKNEASVMNVLRFLGFVGDEDTPTEAARTLFTTHNEEAFQKQLSSTVAEAYAGIFESFGDDSWTLAIDPLINWFRTEDKTSELVGKRQAHTFRALAEQAGHLNTQEKSKVHDSNATASSRPARSSTTAKKPLVPSSDTSLSTDVPPNTVGNFGLTVRIEVNLPTDGDQAVYDRIFKSIRQNLIDGSRS